MENRKTRIEDFISGFMGYGSLNAPLWYIGPEEAGARCPEDLYARVEAWEKLGREPVVDIYEYGALIGNTELFEADAAPQATWRRLTEITLLLNQQEPTREAIREFQHKKLGRPQGRILLTELMPIPKPSITSWPYAELASEVPYLSDLKSYRKAVRPLRIRMLREAIRRYEPERVFFYGTTGRVVDAWQEIAVAPLKAVEGDYRTATSGATTYVALKHPNARGKTRQYFLEAASVARRS